VLGDGPQALAERYPALQDTVFTSGPKTLGNPGHANALWTFLMPFSRFFGHYSGQIYKVPGALTSEMTDTEIDDLFERVVRRMLRREQFIALGDTLSMCGFTWVLFSQNGEGERLDDGDLLVRTLRAYGIETTRTDLAWFAEAFWAQSMVLKMEHGWTPPTAEDVPARVFEALSQALDFSQDELRALMDRLIVEWKEQASEVLAKYGYTLSQL
jgi:aldehyde:ferredoxin oxidoreductase